MSRIPQLWVPRPIPIIPFLVELRELVVSRSTKSFPHWRFHGGERLMIDLQPRPADALNRTELYRGVALEGEGLSATSFDDPPRGIWSCRFTIGDGMTQWYRDNRVLDEDRAWTAWWFFFRSGRWPHDPLRDRAASQHRVTELLGRVRDVLTPALRLTMPGATVPGARSLISFHCLCCGRGLTDPVSMARLIGPECYGSAATWVHRHMTTTPDPLVAAETQAGSFESAPAMTPR